MDFDEHLNIQSIYQWRTTTYISRALMSLFLKRCHVRPVAVVGKEEVRARARPFFRSFFLAQYRDVSVHLNPIPIPLPPLACLLTSFTRKLPLNASPLSASAPGRYIFLAKSNKCYHWFSTLECLKY